MKKLRLRISTLLLAAILAVAAMPTPTIAGTFPGTNGLIAFTTNRDGNQEIYTINPDGTNPVNLSQHLARDTSASWSPDGRKIAFQTDRDGNNEIYIMDADGSNQTPLSNNVLSDTAPSWSADGTSIAFVRELPGNNSEIFTMRADGSGQTNISNNLAPDTDPTWSPLGSKILFTSLRPETGNRDLYTMNTDGTNQTLYIGGGGAKLRGSWAPDGIGIVFRGQFERDELYVVGVGLFQQLTNNFNVEDIAPSGAWSPDGKLITYQNTLNCNVEICSQPGDESSEIYILSS